MVKPAGSLSCFVEFAAHGLHGFDEARRRRRARAEERVAKAHRAGQRLRSVGAEPDWRMRPLHGLGLDRQPVDVAEAAVIRHGRLVGPRRLHQLQPLGEAADERRLLDAERLELPEAAAGRDPEVEPAVAEPVDGGDRRRQLQRIVQRRDEHRDTESQPGGAARRHRPAAPCGAISGAGPIVCSNVQPPSKPSSSARAR